MGQIHGSGTSHYENTALVTDNQERLVTGSNTLGFGDTIIRHDRSSQYTIDGFADTQTIHLDTGEVSTQTAFMLIDISDTTNWAHTETDHVIIRSIVNQIDPDYTYLGEVDVGFLSDVDATNGDLNHIIDITVRKKSDLIIQNLEFTGGFHCQASTHFGPKTINSTLFQTDVNLAGPDGNTSFPSNNGDLVMIVDRDAGAVNVSVTIIYETVGA